MSRVLAQPDLAAAQSPVLTGKRKEPDAPPAELRAFGDAKATRNAIFQKALDAAKSLPPHQNARYTFQLADVHYAKDPDPSLKEQKRAILEGRSLARRLRGTWELRDTTTGDVLEQKPQTIARIPYYTDRGTMIHNGSEYVLANQLRLRPGIYSRIKENGGIESHVNVMPGQGHSHRYSWDPEKGIFHTQLGQAKIPLLPLLRALGAQDKELKDAWGPEVYASNLQADNPVLLRKYYDRLLRAADRDADEPSKREALKKAVLGMGLDPEVTHRTLGFPAKNLDLPTILAATKKLLAISRDEAEPDDRDHLANQTVHGPEDLIAERLSKDYGGIRRGLFQRSVWSGSLKHVPPNALGRQVLAALLHSGLGMAPEEVNALELFDKQSRLTRMGEGGLPSLDSIPDESRAVSPSHLAFCDPIRTPESSRVGVDVQLASAVRKGSDGKIYAPFIDARTKKTVYKSPQDVADLAVTFPGEMDRPGKRVFAMDRGRMRLIPKSQVDLVPGHFEHAFSTLGNLVPMKSANKGHRMAMGSRMITQALPLIEPEAPWVRSGVPGKPDTSYHEEYGKYAGAIRADQPGRVLSADADGIQVRYADGKEATIELANEFPYNRKSVTGDTVIMIRRAGAVLRTKIADYRWKDEDETLSIDPGNNCSAWLPVTGCVKHRNDKRLFRAYTKSGRHVDLTEDHSLVTLGDAGELVPIYPLDCVLGRTRLPLALIPEHDTSARKVKHDLEMDRGRVAGLYLAEGCISKKHPNQICIAVQPDNRARQVLDLLGRVSTSGYAPYRNGGGAYVTDAKLSCWLRDTFGKYAHGKHIPAAVLNESRAFRRGLIEGYLAGDGCLWADGNGVIQVTAVSVSQQLRDDLMDVLASLGVFTTAWDVPLHCRNANWRDGYGLRIITRHLDRLPRWFFYGDREVRLDELRGKTRASTFELIPVPRGARPLLYAGFAGKVPHFVHKTASQDGCVAKHRVVDCESVYGRWGCSDVLWDTLSRLEPLPPQKFVYDLEVAASQNFAVCHGLIVHNTSYHQTALVKPGEQFQAGQLLARSNYTDKNGIIALGKNLRVAYLPFRGKTFEDAVVVSESAAKKLTSAHVYQHRLEPDEEHKLGRGAYTALFPGKYPRQLLEQFDEHGVIRPGTRVQYDEPLILAARRVPEDTSRVHRKGAPSYTDASVTWHHRNPGVVTDVAMTDRGITVLVKSQHPLSEGDKLSGTHGDKGIVAEIVPDSQMPHDTKGQPFEILVDPSGLSSRTNTAQIMEGALGKISAKTGKPYNIQDFEHIPDLEAFAEAELRKHGMSDTEDVIDPETGRKIPGVFAGNRFFMKLQHEAESKGQGRGTGGYSFEETPTKGGEHGAKRIGIMESNALISHGATSVLRDAFMNRGQKNDEQLLAFMQGFTPPSPKIPVVYQKFINQLKASGINVVSHGTSMQVMAMTDKDIDQLAGDRELTSGETVNFSKGLVPVTGGLFDPKLTGGHRGCFHSSVQIWTEQGMLPIGQIVRERLQVRVWTFDFKSRHFSLKPITGWFENYSPEGIGRATFAADGRLTAGAPRFNPTTLWGTRRHQVYDQSGNKRDLAIATELVAATETLSRSQEQLLYGTLLGAGYVSPTGQYSTVHGIKQAGYAVFKCSLFAPLCRSPLKQFWDTSGGMIREKVSFTTRAHRAFREARTLCYPAGRKTVTKAWLDKIDELGLAFWVFDDGHVRRSKTKRTITAALCTEACTWHEIQLIQTWFHTRWNLSSFVRRHGKKYGDRDCGWQVCFAGAAAEDLLDLIAPFAVPCLHYKFPSPPAVAYCKRCCREIASRRRICNLCCLAEAAACGSHKLPKHLRRLFGGTASLRNLLASGVVPPDDLGRDRWEARQACLGKAVTGVLQDVQLGKAIVLVPCNYQWQTGCKWERTRTVYDIEVADNHNYFANGILVSNSRWSHIKLAEPMLNPVMEDAARRLLGLTQKKFESVLTGTEEMVSGGLRSRGPQAIQRALAAINVPREIAIARAQIHGNRKTARDEAVRKLGYLKAAERLGIHPKDWVLTKVPVLPPIFRPVSLMQQTNQPLVSDANFLYKELFDANKLLGQMQKETDDVGEERLNLYHSFKAVDGLADPLHPKLVEKKVRGALGHIFGDSPKHSTVQRRLLSRTTDLVGRAVVSPDPDLDMDHVGLPETRAWDLYKNFIVRRLRRRGLPLGEAARQVRDRTPLARQEMLEEMEKRPVFINRAPVLHRFGIMAFWPQLTKGDVLKVSPLICKGFGMDFNGDSCRTPLLPVLVSGKLFLGDFESFIREYVMPDYTEASAVSQIGKQTLVLNFDPRFDVRVPGIGADGKVGWCSVSHISIHTSHGPDCYQVRTERGLDATFTAHHNFLGLDSDLNLTARKTTEIQAGSPVPVLFDFDTTIPGTKAQGKPGLPLTFATGCFIGHYLGDGSLTGRNDTLLQASTDQELLELLEQAGKKFTKAKAWREGNGKSVRWTDKRLVAWFEQQFGRGFAAKRVPGWCVTAPRRFREGLLVGFLLAEGAVTSGCTQTEVANRPLLLGVQMLSATLGISASVRPGRPERKSKKTNATLAATYVLRTNALMTSALPWPKISAAGRFANYARDGSRQVWDRVPYPNTIAEIINGLGMSLQAGRGRWLSVRGLRYGTQRAGQFVAREDRRYAERTGLCTRAMALKLIRQYQLDQLDEPRVIRWIALVRNTQVIWDVVEKVEPVARPIVTYDFHIPPAENFCIDGFFLTHNTAQYHVPFTDDAAKEAAERMLPSRNLLSPADFKTPMHMPSQLFLAGLFAATRPPNTKKPVRRFLTAKDAVAAYHRGELAIDSPVEIGS